MIYHLHHSLGFNLHGQPSSTIDSWAFSLRGRGHRNERFLGNIGESGDTEKAASALL